MYHRIASPHLQARIPTPNPMHSTKRYFQLEHSRYEASVPTLPPSSVSDADEEKRLISYAAGIIVLHHTLSSSLTAFPPLPVTPSPRPPPLTHFNNIHTAMFKSMSLSLNPNIFPATVPTPSSCFIVLSIAKLSDLDDGCGRGR